MDEFENVQSEIEAEAEVEAEIETNDGGDTADEINAAVTDEAVIELEPVLTNPEPNRRDDPPAKTKTSFKTIAAIAALASVLGGFSIGLGIGAVTTAVKIVFPQIEAETAETGGQQVENPIPGEVLAFNNQVSSALSPDENLPGSFSELVQRVEPSVVNISAVMQGNQSYFSVPETPRGSGIIFREDDEKVYIITNYHVVSGAEYVGVSVEGSEPVSAGLVGKEQQSDLAVLFITKAELAEAGVEKVTVAKFSDSDKILVGDIVLVIGNAMGEGNTATLGIISAKNKQIQVENIQLTVIQTDAAMNPGNSGGALVNMNGEVIGINTAKTMQQYFGTSAEGMGYSIASDIMMPIAEEIMLMKPKAFLGIRGETVSKEIAELFNIPELGVLIDEVVPNMSAEAAGLQKTDIITSFNGEAVFNMSELQAAVKKCEVGQEVEIKILRDGKTPMTLKVKMLASDDVNF